MRTPFGHREPVSPEVVQAQAVARKPFFRGATLIGFLVGLLLFGLIICQYRAGRRGRALKRQAKAVKPDSNQPIQDVDGGPAVPASYPVDPLR